MLGLLNILEPYNITSLSPLNVHRMVEAMKFAFGARSEITDPSFARNVSRFEEFYGKGWAVEKRGLLDEVCIYLSLSTQQCLGEGCCKLHIADRNI